MSRLIKATPDLKGKEAIKFLNKIHKEEYIPSYPIPTPKLVNAVKLISELRKNK
jgi:hypothetical protein